jgi:hypothetical protein
MKRFYKEFCFAIMRNKNPAQNGLEEVNVYDILIEMQMIPSSGINSPRKGLRKKFTIPVSGATGMAQYDKSIQSMDDGIKNLFKILCGVMNMRLV